jgi:hypothetical protein
MCLCLVNYALVCQQKILNKKLLITAKYKAWVTFSSIKSHKNIKHGNLP